VFHKHKWELIDKTIIPAAKDIGNFNVWGQAYAEATKAILEAKRDKVVHVFKCECGEVKVVKN
jgi:hypothetical protein